MQSKTFYAMPESIADPLVALTFADDLPRETGTELPNDDQIVLVDGVERYYWLERKNPGQPSESWIMTTDDARRYTVLPDASPAVHLSRA